jgi:hypothetical protein
MGAAEGFSRASRFAAREPSGKRADRIGRQARECEQARGSKDKRSLASGLPTESARLPAACLPLGLPAKGLLISACPLLSAPHRFHQPSRQH